MGHLLFILLAVVGQGLVEAGFELDFDAPLAVAALALVPLAVGQLVRRAALRGRFALANVLARLLRALPVLLYVAALALFGWRRNVSSWVGAEVSLFEWPRASLLFVFLPFVVYSAATIDAQARLRAESRLRRSVRALELRMLAAGLAPLVAYVLGSAAIGLSRELSVRIEEVAAFNAIYSACFFGVMIAVLPQVLRASFDTVPLPPGGLRGMLEEVARRARFRCKELLVWRTGQLMPNAAIIGLWKRQRIVLFSDSLLGMLRADELAAVYAHEIGHAARRHVPIFLCWTAGFFMAADLLASWLDPRGELLALGVLAAALALWFTGFGWLSRRFELDADLFSLELTGEGESLARALEAVGGNLRDVASWRHFSAAERASFLRRARAEPGFARRFRARLALWTAAGVALVCVTGGLEAWSMRRSFPAQAAAADVRLGRLEVALERVDRIAARGGESELRELALRAESEAAVALAEDDPHHALDWMRLGARAGKTELTLAADALDDALAGRGERAARRLDETPAPWGDALRAWLGRPQPTQPQ